MKRLSWQIILGLILIFTSALIYFIHFLIFRDTYHIFIYLLGDIAFTPIEVLLVTLIIDRVLSLREKRSTLEKLNMVIGAFYSEVGLKLLKYFLCFDISADEIKKELSFLQKWSVKDFDKIIKSIDKFKYTVNCKIGNLNELKGFLIKKRQFLLRLLENPNLLEHEKFTELLWAVFHLTEELEYRKDLSSGPDSDFEHISGDIKRAYILVISEWLKYVKHLKLNYPYLYSLISRINPLDENASIIVT